MKVVPIRHKMTNFQGLCVKKKNKTKIPTSRELYSNLLEWLWDRIQFNSMLYHNTSNCYLIDEAAVSPLSVWKTVYSTVSHLRESLKYWFQIIANHFIAVISMLKPKTPTKCVTGFALKIWLSNNMYNLQFFSMTCSNYILFQYI